MLEILPSSLTIASRQERQGEEEGKRENGCRDLEDSEGKMLEILPSLPTIASWQERQGEEEGKRERMDAEIRKRVRVKMLERAKVEGGVQW